MLLTTKYSFEALKSLLLKSHSSKLPCPYQSLISPSPRAHVFDNPQDIRTQMNPLSVSSWQPGTKCPYITATIEERIIPPKAPSPPSRCLSPVSLTGTANSAAAM